MSLVSTASHNSFNRPCGSIWCSMNFLLMYLLVINSCLLSLRVRTQNESLLSHQQLIIIYGPPLFLYVCFPSPLPSSLPPLSISPSPLLPSLSPPLSSSLTCPRQTISSLQEAVLAPTLHLTKHYP